MVIPHTSANNLLKRELKREKGLLEEEKKGAFPLAPIPLLLTGWEVREAHVYSQHVVCIQSFADYLVYILQSVSEVPRTSLLSHTTIFFARFQNGADVQRRVRSSKIII